MVALGIRIRETADRMQCGASSESLGQQGYDMVWYGIVWYGMVWYGIVYSLA